MAASIRRLDFVFLCDRNFEELDGSDPIVRRCGKCNTDVFDLDAFTDAQREAFLAAADEAGMELCARLSVGADAPSCAKHMKPGTYTGRTEASLRRFNTRPDRPIAERIKRHETATAEVTKLVSEARRNRG